MATNANFTDILLLTGGQILAKRLKKHVLKISVTDAAWDSYEGLEFYNFDHIGSHNEFKSLYRQRLDEAHVTQRTKGEHKFCVVLYHNFLLTLNSIS